jgi:cation transport ATPase
VSTGQAPALAVLGVVAAGLLVVAAVDWQPGVVVLAAGLALAALLRLVLPVRRAGWLAVRGKAMDVAVLVVLATGLAVLAGVVPQG